MRFAKYLWLLFEAKYFMYRFWYCIIVYFVHKTCLIFTFEMNFKGIQFSSLIKYRGGGGIF
jgi:hypothetical protein